MYNAKTNIKIITIKMRFLGSTLNIEVSISMVLLFDAIFLSNKLVIIIIKQVKKKTQPICTKKGMV